jgi:hypothetical protein
LEDAADSRLDSVNTVCIRAESELVLDVRSGFWSDRAEGDVLASSCALVMDEFSPKLASRKVLKLAESSKVEAKEFPKDDAEARLCCFLSP